MKKPIALSLVLAGLAGLLAPEAEASCFFPRGPRHIEAEVVTCEAARARAERELAKQPTTYPNGATQAEVVENILKHSRPSQVVSLKVIRFQQLPEETRGTPEVFAKLPWTVEEKPEVKEYLVSGVASCAEFPPGGKALFLEWLTCCDTIPAANLPCLVGLPELEPDA